MTKAPKLYKLDDDKIYKGVSSGIGNYLGLNEYIVRLFFILTSLYSGIGILVYYILDNFLFTKKEINMFLEQRRWEFIHKGKLIEIENIEKMEAKIDDKKIKVLYIAIIFSVIAAILYSFILVRIYPWEIMKVEYQVASFVLILILINTIIYFKNKSIK